NEKEIDSHPADAGERFDHSVNRDNRRHPVEVAEVAEHDEDDRQPTKPIERGDVSAHARLNALWLGYCWFVERRESGHFVPWVLVSGLFAGAERHGQMDSGTGPNV